MLELIIAVAVGIGVVWVGEMWHRLNQLARRNLWLVAELNRLVGEIEATEKLLYNRLDASDGYHEYLPLPELVKMVLGGEDEPVYRERKP